MKLKVTQQDITRGRNTPDSETKCPLGRAAQRTFGERATVIDTGLDIIVRIRLPRTAREFVERLYTGKGLKPFTISL